MQESVMLVAGACGQVQSGAENLYFERCHDQEKNGRHFSLNPDTEEAQDEMYCRASSLALLHSLVVSAIYAESVRQFL